MAIVGGGVAWFAPGMEDYLSLFIWLVPLTLLILTVLYGLIVSLWNLHREDRQEVDEPLLELSRNLESAQRDREVASDKLQAGRASLATIWRYGHPYYWREEQWYRIGLANGGPSLAENVEVWLDEIEPYNPMPANILPSRLGRKAGQTRDCAINPQGRELFGVLQYFTEPTKPLRVEFWTEESGGQSELDDRVEFVLKIRATAANADPTTREFRLSNHSNFSLSFSPSTPHPLDDSQ